LGAGNNETLKANALNGYIEGFITLYKRDGSLIWKYVDQFNDTLALKAKDQYIKDKLADNGKKTLVFFIHEMKYNDFAEKYTSENNHKNK